MPQPRVSSQKPPQADYTFKQPDGKVKGKADKVGKTAQSKSSTKAVVDARTSKAAEPLKKKAKEREFDQVQKNLAKFAKGVKKADESESDARTKAQDKASFWEFVPEKLGKRISSLRTKLAVSYMYTIPAFSPITAEFTFKGKSYHLMKSSVTNISQKPYASCGSSSAREILLIDPKNATLLNWHYKELKKSLLKKHEASLGGLSTEEFLSFVKEYVQKSIFPSWNNPDVVAMTEEVITEGKKDTDNIIYDNKGRPQVVLNIEDFVRRGIGVCRHHALVTGYLLDLLCRDTEVPFAPLGIVQNIRDNIPAGGHVWATLLEKDKKFHIDTLWNIVHEFGTEKQQAELVKKGYGDRSIKYQVSKANESDAVFQAVAVSRGLKA